MRLVNLKRLRALVEVSGLTQRELADKTGLSHGMIGGLLAGTRKGCRRESYEALLAVLGPQLATVFEPRRKQAA